MKRHLREISSSLKDYEKEREKEVSGELLIKKFARSAARGKYFEYNGNKFKFFELLDEIKNEEGKQHLLPKDSNRCYKLM